MAKKIILAVFCGIVGFGIILALVGAMLGGTIGSFRYEDSQLIYREGDKQVALAQVPRWASRLAGGSRLAAEVPADPDAPIALQAPAPFSDGELRALDIDIGAGYVIIQPGESFGVEVDGPMEYDSSYENGEWIFTANPPDSITTWDDGGLLRFLNGDDDITTTFVFTVPDNFEKLELDIDMGEGEVELLNLQNLACSSGMGSITLDEITAGEANLTVSMGSIDAYSFTVTDCELKCEMGGIDIEGAVLGRLTANCDMGSIYASLEEPDDYGWNAKADLGSATVNGHSVSGLNSETSGGNASAATYFDLACGMGSIEIEFY